MIPVSPCAQTVEGTTIAGMLPRQAVFSGPNTACHRDGYDGVA